MPGSVLEGNMAGRVLPFLFEAVTRTAFEVHPCAVQHVYVMHLIIMCSLLNGLSSSIKNFKMQQLMAFKSTFVAAPVKFPPFLFYHY